MAADGPRVIEVAARLGGGHDAELCEAAVGVDLNALAITAALGETAAEPEARPRVGGAATVFLTAEPGEVEEIEGRERAEHADGVIRVRIYRRPGFVVDELRRGADRVGAIQAVGPTRDAALGRARATAALIRFRTRAAAPA